MKSIIIPIQFLKAIGEKPHAIRIYWIKWLADYSEQLFKPDFIETFVKDMEGKKLNLETIKEAYDFGISFFEDGFKFIDNNKKKTTVVSEQSKELINKVLEYLNDKSFSSYEMSKTNIQVINSRIKEGYCLKDFKAVIDNKCKQWLNTEQQKYLRPITLFQASKFENYLNEPQTEINGKQKSTSAIAKLQFATQKAKSYFK